MNNRNNYFEEINFDLRNRIIFLDIDGTLVPDRGLNFDLSVLRQLEKLKAQNRVFLCTNSNDKIRKAKIERLLDLPIVTHRYKKPGSKMLAELNLKPRSKELLVIGDKFLTDGLFAKNIGAEFIKAKRKISGQESILIKLINLFDDLLCLLLGKLI